MSANCPPSSVQVGVLNSETLSPQEELNMITCDTELCTSLIDPLMLDVEVTTFFTTAPLVSVPIEKLLDPSSPPEQQLVGAKLAGGVLHWKTFLCLFFSRDYYHFNLNASPDAKQWGGQFNKYISFDGCYRVNQNECDDTAGLSPSEATITWHPFCLSEKILSEWKGLGQNTLACIHEECWDPCNKLLIEKELQKVCSLWDVYKRCLPKCARTWHDVLRAILINAGMSAAPRDSVATDCYKRNVPAALQTLDIGTLFSALGSKCPKVYVNFNYQVYMGEEAARFPLPATGGPADLQELAENGWDGQPADKSIFNCVCGNCWELA